MKKVIFIIFILTNNLMIGQDKVEFKLKIESYGLPYTMINAKLEVENKSKDIIKVPKTDNLWELVEEKVFKFEVEGDIDLNCFFKEYKEKEVAGLRYQDLKPGEKKEYSNSIIERQVGIINEGEYYIKGIWDSTRESKGYKCKWESEWIKIELRAEGEDRTLIEELKKNYPNGYKCMLIDLAFNKNLREYVLEKYPTSTYAGWVLAESIYSGGQLECYERKEYIDKMINFFTLSDDDKKLEMYGKTDIRGWTSPSEFAKKYVDLAENFLKIHNDFGALNGIYLKLAIAYMALNKWQEADSYIGKIIKNEKNGYLYRGKMVDECKDKIEYIREALKKRGFLKSE
jgi:hypothetical protein